MENIQFEVWSWEGGRRGEEIGEKELRMKRNKNQVKKIVSFINTTSNPRPLLASLQDTIASHFLAKVGPVGLVQTVRLDRPGLQPLHVDEEGVLLLLHAREGLLLGSVRLGDGPLTGALLMALSSLASGRGVELEVDRIRCNTEEEGLALTHLLDCCMSWKVRLLYLRGQVGQGAWEGLARAADRGTVGTVEVDRDVLRRGNIEDVKKVWECTELGNGWWKVGNEFVWREGIVKEPGGGRAGA